MINRVLLVVTIILSIINLFMGSRNTTFFKHENKITVKDTDTDNISEMNLEEYIVGVVAAEMPASFNIEALKAQAIAARTYAVYKMNNSKEKYDIVTDVTNQSYLTIGEMKTKWGDDFQKYYEKVKEAVNSTNNKVMKYDDQVIEAYYFAMSNGYTEESELVFQEDRNYLQSVESIYENESLKNFIVSKEISKTEFCNLLEITCNDILITNIKRSKTNRVNEITINNKLYKGTEVRAKLNLRSTDFTINIKEDNVEIITKGYGHGVGMSQYGASEMAKRGYNYEDILNYFYKNIEIKTI